MPITRVTQAPGDCIDLLADHGHAATYRYAPTLPKPTFHPLTTPRGHRITGFEPSDHTWHRGLWFTIKYINGKNFWEESEDGRGHGVQVTDAPPACAFLDADTLRIAHRLRWVPLDPGSTPVFHEERTLTFRALPGGVRAIDWHATLTPAADLTLDRTPYTTWGGYGGLSFRGSRELHKARFLLPDGDATPSLTGQPHDWVVLVGQMDGGADEHVSLGLIDHPANPRSPSPWYGKVGEVNFINAAFLFHEKMEVAADRPLTFRYRVLFRDGEWSRDEFAALADAFRKE